MLTLSHTETIDFHYTFHIKILLQASDEGEGTKFELILTYFVFLIMNGFQTSKVAYVPHALLESHYILSLHTLCTIAIGNIILKSTLKTPS